MGFCYRITGLNMYIWSEVTQRVNYPIKALVELVDAHQLDIDDKLAQYCDSNLGVELSEIAINIVIASWNVYQAGR